MKKTPSATEGNDPLSCVLGYLNFSSGSPDPRFLASLNALYQWHAEGKFTAEQAPPPPGKSNRNLAGRWLDVVRRLQAELQGLAQTNDTFADIGAGLAVLDTLEKQLVPDYLDFHSDLLFHLTTDEIFNPYMLGRACEVLLRQTPPWTDATQVSATAIRNLNDFVGYRPVPTLESHRIEAYPHERIRPIPLYIAGASTACGPFQELIDLAVKILQETEEHLSHAAWFDFGRLEELALDPRAYDFDHPVNKRPNYHFGEWDPHRIDNQGFYRRFVIREVTIRALLSRVEDSSKLKINRTELMFEAAAVLVGTIFMASAITGDSPTCHDSNTTLVNLMPRIATFRDAFYENWIDRLPEKHAKRLRKESEKLQQPFAGARHHLNLHLARQRASQLEHVRLAKVFARMGYPEAALRQADRIPVASARMSCRVDCALTTGYHALRKLDRENVQSQLRIVLETLRRGIACGAIVDPWNILGFDAQFSLFPALENSVHDHRIDELLRIMDRTFDLLARLWSDAAAANDIKMADAVAPLYQETASWWNQFAAHEVTSVDSDPPLIGWQAAKDVAVALQEWHKAGAQKGDISFWAPHVQSFTSPKAYALVIETLLARGDDGSAMSLLVHWVSQSERVPLEQQDSSFPRLAMTWVRRNSEGIYPEDRADPKGAAVNAELLRKFYDFLEANAEHLWDVPEYEMRSARNASHDSPRQLEGEEVDENSEDEDLEHDLFEAAYENVVYRDTTDDGVDGSIFDTDSQVHESARSEAERIVARLQFLRTLGNCWLHTAPAFAKLGTRAPEEFARLRLGSSLEGWLDHVRRTRQQATQLLADVAAERLPMSGVDVSSMMEYDQLRVVKDTLLEHILATCVEMAEAELYLSAALIATGSPTDNVVEPREPIDQELLHAARIIAAAMVHDRVRAAELAPSYFARLSRQQILYTPLARGGLPMAIADARIRRRGIRHILIVLPRLGLLNLTTTFVDTVREMEQNVPLGGSAITEFDESFDVAMHELVQALVRSTAARPHPRSATAATDVAVESEEDLVGCLEQLSERVLATWLEHSRTLRLSVLERVRELKAWEGLVAFIRQYGHDLFTQDFLYFSNIRAILHCGPEKWLTQLKLEDQSQTPPQLIEALDRDIPLRDAAENLGLILEAVAENYDEYRDYNSTTTQSDRGEMLYTLLDFLRLRSQYDRVAWNLRPVVLAHRVLVEERRNEAAQLWRRLLHDRLGEEADRYQRKLTRLQSKYAMQMGSIAQRIGQRFLQPMTIDRMRALVRVAINQVRDEGPHHAFEILEEEAELLMRDPAGWGVAISDWLEALEEEVQRYDPARQSMEIDEDVVPVESLRMNHEQVQAELRTMLGSDESE